MDPTKLNDMQRYLLEEEMENLQQRRIARRVFLQRAGAILGSTAAAVLIANQLGCSEDPPPPGGNPDLATGGGADLATGSPPDLMPVGPGVPENDPAIRAGAVEIPHNNGAFKLTGYQATPATVTPGSPAVLLIHENRALTPYILDVVRRWGKTGYVTLCVDLLSRQGGTAAFPDENNRPGALSALAPEQAIADLSAGLDYLKGRPGVKPERLGVTGFCFGGGYTWRLCTQRADVRAGVAFYGPNPPLADVPKIKAAMLGIYGSLDTRITDTVPMLEAALKMTTITYELKIYQGVAHAFHNNTGANYNEAAAQQAWAQALAWMARHLA